MKIYAHRGNLRGPESGENALDGIEACLDSGVGVELDVWGLDEEIWVGHDRPGWKIETKVLENNSVICHAKNVEAVMILSRLSTTYFSIDRDPFSLCSNGLIWANYGCSPTPVSIMCSPELVMAVEGIEEFYERISNSYGVCSDYPLLYQQLVRDRSTLG